MPPASQATVEWTKVTWYSKALAVVLFVGLVCGAFFFGVWYQRAISENQGNPTAVAPGSGDVVSAAGGGSNGSDYTFVEQHRAESRIFYCASLRNTESNCRLFVSTLDGLEREYTGITLDYNSQGKGLLLSPDKKRLLVVLDKEALVVDTDTLEKKTLILAAAGTAYGTYTALPSFVPYARWVDNDTVELSVYPDGTQETYNADEPPQPLKRETVEVN